MGMYLHGLVLAKVDFQACARGVEGRPSLFSGSSVVLAGTQTFVRGPRIQEHTAGACLCGWWWPGWTQVPGGVWCDEDTGLSWLRQGGCWSAGHRVFSPGVSSAKKSREARQASRGLFYQQP